LTSLEYVVVIDKVVSGEENNVGCRGEYILVNKWLATQPLINYPSNAKNQSKLKFSALALIFIE